MADNLYVFLQGLTLNYEKDKWSWNYARDGIFSVAYSYQD